MFKKVGHPTNKDPHFWDDLNKCVWGSETKQEFEMHWNELLTGYDLHGNE
jgi:hypothetical protein